MRPESKKDIEKRARSESMNKWIGVFKEEFDIEAEGDTPTERMRQVIEQLRQLAEGAESIEQMQAFIRKKITKWYRIGARRGALELALFLKEKGVLNDEDLPERITWKKGLTYIGFDGEKKRLKEKEYSADF
jgi:hypothetical protein